MTITIEVPKILVKAAAASGRPVEEYVQLQLQPAAKADSERRGFRRLGDGIRPLKEVVEEMLESRKHFPLGDVTIKQLIEEGRDRL